MVFVVRVVAFGRLVLVLLLGTHGVGCSVPFWILFVIFRQELVLHGWDVTGDDAAAQAPLAEPWMTTHSVVAVGRPLLAKGAKLLEPGERIDARLRVFGSDDVVIAADAEQTSIGMAEPEGPATLETDAAARVLLLWGRRPGNPSRVCSDAGPELLGQVRRLLSGY